MSDRSTFHAPPDEIDRWLNEPVPVRKRPATVTDIRPRIEARRDARSQPLGGREMMVRFGPNHRRR